MKLFTRFLSAALSIFVALAQPSFARNETVPSSMEEIRAYSASHNSFNFIPLAQLPQMQSYLKIRTPYYYQIAMQELKHVDVAVKDLDFDGKNDTVLYFHGPNYCGTIGCTFDVIPGDYKKQIIDVSGKGINPIRRGVEVDGNAYHF